MDDHKTKSEATPDQMGDPLGTQECLPAEIVAAESTNERGLLRIGTTPPILQEFRAALHSRHEKMPEEGADMVRSGFAVASLMLGSLALLGSWISAWALIPFGLAIILAPAGLLSKQRRLAILGAILGVVAFGIMGIWMNS